MQNRPLQFGGTVRTQPAGVLAGNFKCTLMAQGLHFQDKKQEFLIPVGTPAQHVKQNKVLIHLPDYRIELTVNLPGSYTFRLARDLVPFLTGHGPAPQPAAYRMPWYFWILILLPVGIMAITRGGAIPGAVSGGLAALNYGLLQNEDWPLPLRLVLTLAVSAAAYALLFALLNSPGFATR